MFGVKVDMYFFTNRPSVQEEQVSAWSWMLHSIFNEIHNSVAFELREAAKAEVTWKKYPLVKLKPTILFNKETQDIWEFEE